MDNLSREDASEFISIVAGRLAEEIEALHAHGLPAGENRILVALSGGPDSTALLIALAQTAANWGWKLSACHINHCLRGLESDLDQEFCKSVCGDLGVEFAAYRPDDDAGPDIESVYGTSASEASADLTLGLDVDLEANPDESDSPPDQDYVSEDALRKFRYELLRRRAHERDIRIIVTGHTLDDQAETILFRLFRGTSPTGLKGIENHRPLVVDEGIWLVRPMLSLTKADCQRFLAIEQIAASFDSSNADTHYARNFIRAQLVPVIDERFPGWKQRLERLRKTVGEQDEWHAHEVARTLKEIAFVDAKGEGISIPKFRELHVALQRLIVASLMRKKNVEPSYERIEHVITLSRDEEGAVSLSVDWQVRVDGNKLRWLANDFSEPEAPSAFLLAQEAVIGLPEGECKSRSNIVGWLNMSLKVEVWEEENGGIVYPPRNALEVVVDLSRIDKPLRLRLRRPGDVIQPFGMKELVRLKKYLHTHKSPEEEETPDERLRHTIVLTDGAETLWVPGFGLSEKLRVTGKPTHRLTFQRLSFSSDNVWA